MVRVERIELSPQPWEGYILPLNYTRALGATCRDRTGDLLVTNEMLYRLS